MKHRLRFSAVFLLAAAGCAPFTSRRAIEAVETSPGRVVQIVEKNYSRIRNLHGRGRMQVEATGRSFSLGAQVAVQYPDTLFIRLEAVFGIDVGWLFADRQRFTFFIPMQNSYLTGATDSLSTSPLFDFEMPYPDLINTLGGRPMIGELQTADLKKTQKEWILSGGPTIERRLFWIDPRRGVVTRAEVRDSSGQAILVQQFERFGRIDGVYLPHTIRLLRPLEKQGMTLFYETLTLNAKSMAKVFKRKIPQNARRIEFDEVVHENQNR